MKEALSQRQHFIGATLLIAGCCIGAGMLGLPLVTSLAGFVPASVALVLSWLFMLVTGLLLVEVYLYFSDDISFGTMAFRTTGKWGERFCWLFFLFLFYSLLVAYVSGTGALIQDLFWTYTSFEPPLFVTSLIPTLFVGIFIYLGAESTDLINRIFMVGLAISYFALIAFSFPHIDRENLREANWLEALFILPTFIISFGYHNLVPGISHYLKRNVKAIKWAIIIGSSVPFFIYFVWEWALLGMIPLDGESGFREAPKQGLLASQILRNKIGYSAVSEIAELFSFFALITSFLAVALSITDFLADGLKLPKTSSLNIFLLCLIVLIPPFIFGLADPTLFLTALRHAGGIGAVALYGVLPVLMVWRGRYSLGLVKEELIPWGKGGLIMILILAFIIITLHLLQEFGISSP